MRQQVKVYLLALGFALAGTLQAIGPQPDTFTTIDVPGATFTAAQGINPRGDIGGQYIGGGVTHGFLLSGASLHRLISPTQGLVLPVGSTRAATSWDFTRVAV